ncbi:MAG: SGNH/GDSL hydrolase family protein [Candidatus Limnocylindrales bacterium]
MDRVKSWFASRPLLAAGLGLLAVAATSLVVTLGLASALAGGNPAATAGASPDATPSISAAASTSDRSPGPAPTPSNTPEPTASPTPTPAPTLPQLPALLGAIGDSYSQAFNVAAAYPRDHPQFSWVIGTAKNDGVFSLAERFSALGRAPVLVDAATSGRMMNDAPRQARAVVAAAGKLSSGQTAYVTFELGTNDLCVDSMTDPSAFEADLRSAVSILRAGLPAGSRILMMSVPDFSHFRDITQLDPKAKAFLAIPRVSNNCPPFLGENGTTTLDQAETYLRLYDASLTRVCDEIAATDAPTGKLYCTSSQSRLSLSDFTVADLSTVDYFHPSIRGQAKIADAAWAADIWSAVPLPSGAAAVEPAGGGMGATMPVAGPAMVLPLIGSKATRRRG